MALRLDAKSVFAVVAAAFIKQFAGKPSLYRVPGFREFLDKAIFRVLFWFDARDMGPDGLTKGDVS
eukprot:10088239-Lingulodinium_polyedra.AAC.1